MASDIGQRYVPVTRKGKGKLTSGSQTYGESGRVGSTYDANLEERANLSNTRNRGPTGDPSPVGSVPRTTQARRKTGRVE